MLRVIAAAVLGPRGLLLVSKRAAPGIFYLPGGKPDPGEPPLDCLRRELREELSVGVESTRPFSEVRARAALEGVDMWMSVFLTRLTGVPAPAAEIAALRWWPHEPAPGLAPAVRDCVIPSLRGSGLLRRGPRRERSEAAGAAHARDFRPPSQAEAGSQYGLRGGRSEAVGRVAIRELGRRDTRCEAPA